MLSYFSKASYFANKLKVPIIYIIIILSVK
jgi:hypothetical protein